MKHKSHRKRVKRLDKKLRRLAAAVAGAAILSSGMLSGLPSIAHATAAPDTGTNPVEVTQQVHPTAPTAPMAPTGPTTKTPAPPETAGKTAPVQNTGQTKAPAPSTGGQKAGPSAKADTGQKTEGQKNAPKEFEQVLNITATAYAPGPHDNDQWGDKTYTGEQIRPGVVAVDPSVIPLGSRLYIQYPDGHGEYATASDTGGAIKGNRIDVAKWTVNEAEDFGMQHVKVFVVSTPDKEKA